MLRYFKIGIVSGNKLNLVYTLGVKSKKKSSKNENF